MDTGLYTLIGVLVGLVAHPIATFLMERIRYLRVRTNAGHRFQRQTLLDLQECLAVMARMTARLQHHDILKHRETGLWRKSKVPEDIGEGHRRALATASILVERALDDDARLLTLEVMRTSGEMMTTASEAASEDCMYLLTISWRAANSRIGVLLRETYLVDPT